MRSPRATPDLLWAAALPILASAPALATPGGDAGTAAGLTRILIPIGGLIVLAVVGGLGVMAVRKWMLAKDSVSVDHGGMLDDLRRMRDTGQISVEEFDAARKTIAARLAGKPVPGSGMKSPDPGKR